MSKIKNKIAIRKKCIENGDRDFDWGTNPHSKGLIFSCSIDLNKLSTKPSSKISVEIKNLKEKKNINTIIKLKIIKLN